MKFEKIAIEIGKLVNEEDISHGKSFLKSEKILKILYPQGINPDQYKEILAITHIINKLLKIVVKRPSTVETNLHEWARHGDFLESVPNDADKTK